MDATRATLLALTAAVAIAAPAVGQLAVSDPPPLPPPYGVPTQPPVTNNSVSVLPPRPFLMPTLPLLPSRAGAVRTTQYISPPEASGQPIPVGDAATLGQ